MNIFDRLRPLRPESSDLLHLDALRFIASCGIVFHHSHEFFYPPADRAAVLARTLGLGLFVTLFFVISGFVIAYIYTSRMTSLRDFGLFMQRRIGRLAPLHLATLAASILIIVVLTALGIQMNNAPEMSVKCIATTAFLLHSFVDCGGMSFNAVSWSISVEMVMYVLFPAFMLIFSRYRYAALVVAALLAAFFLWLSDGVRWDGWSSLPAPVRALPAFLFGVGLYYGRSVVAKLPYPSVLLGLSVTGLILAMMNGMPAVATVLCYVVPTLCVAADLSGQKSRLISLMAPLGQLTYSVYMIHSLFILVLLNGLGDKLLGLTGWTMYVLTIVTYTIIVGVGYLSYTLLETPARHWIDHIRIFRSASASAGQAATKPNGPPP